MQTENRISRREKRELEEKRERLEKKNRKKKHKRKSSNPNSKNKYQTDVYVDGITTRKSISKKSNKKQKKAKTKWVSIIIKLFIPIMLAFLYSINIITNDSLENHFEPYNLVMYDNIFRTNFDYEVGDLVSISKEIPSNTVRGDSIREVMAKEGDIVVIQDHSITINGHRVLSTNANTYLEPTKFKDGTIMKYNGRDVYRTTVPRGKVFVASKNLGNDIDYKGGMVDKSSIKNRVKQVSIFDTTDLNQILFNSKVKTTLVIMIYLFLIGLLIFI